MLSKVAASQYLHLHQAQVMRLPDWQLAQFMISRLNQEMNMVTQSSQVYSVCSVLLYLQCQHPWQLLILMDRQSRSLGHCQLQTVHRLLNTKCSFNRVGLLVTYKSQWIAMVQMRQLLRITNATSTLLHFWLYLSTFKLVTVFMQLFRLQTCMENHKS